MTVERIGVVGCGLMGSGIAEVAIRSGCDVAVVEQHDEAVRRGRRTLDLSLSNAVRAERLTEADRDAALARLSIGSDFDALADRQLVIEAVAEDAATKTSVFTTLDRIITDPNAIFASNTSSIPIMKLAMTTSRPEQVLGVHFFNPVPAMKLVELIASLLTSESALEAATDFVEGTLGKQVIRSQDRAGFVVNMLLVPYLLSAIRMLESGFATVDDIDQGMVDGCRHPMGPLRLSDLIGLDTVAAVADSLYDEFKEPLYAPPPLLLRMVEAGLLGRKSGRGFWEYGRAPVPVTS